jgi:multicomponent Na+:H+ antiporter subunit C
MTQAAFWAFVGIALVVIGLYALIVHAHLLRKVLALNIMSSGVFLVFIGLSRHAPAPAAAAGPGPFADPVPQAMVLTGIVVAVAATGLALALIVRLRTLSGSAVLGDGVGGVPTQGAAKHHPPAADNRADDAPGSTDGGPIQSRPEN